MPDWSGGSSALPNNRANVKNNLDPLSPTVLLSGDAQCVMCKKTHGLDDLIDCWCTSMHQSLVCTHCMRRYYNHEEKHGTSVKAKFDASVRQAGTSFIGCPRGGCKSTCHPPMNGWLEPRGRDVNCCALCNAPCESNADRVLVCSGAGTHSYLMHRACYEKESGHSTCRICKSPVDQTFAFSGARMWADVRAQQSLDAQQSKSVVVGIKSGGVVTAPREEIDSDADDYDGSRCTSRKPDNEGVVKRCKASRAEGDTRCRRCAQGCDHLGQGSGGILVGIGRCIARESEEAEGD